MRGKIPLLAFGKNLLYLLHWVISLLFFKKTIVIYRFIKTLMWQLVGYYIQKKSRIEEKLHNCCPLSNLFSRVSFWCLNHCKVIIDLMKIKQFLDILTFAILYLIIKKETPHTYIQFDNILKRRSRICLMPFFGRL